ncbi:MAG: excisionase family DNA-binding protein [Terracidiphilus sp.]|jgi:excisionase family DNA binding protein
MKASALKPKLSIPGPAQKGIFEVYTRIRSAETKMAGAGGAPRKLPADPSVFLARLMEQLRTGKPVVIFESSSELTTMEAAKLLAVSRQFLVNLLEGGRIPFHMVGTHRRVYARDVLAFKAARDKTRRKVLDRLARAEMREGLYDRVPLNDCQAK